MITLFFDRPLVPKHLIEEALPAVPGEENTHRLIHLPIIDRPTIKKQAIFAQRTEKVKSS